jgi:hypothetical protein
MERPPAGRCAGFSAPGKIGIKTLPLLIIFGAISFAAVVASALAGDRLFAFHMGLGALIAAGAAVWRIRTNDFS